MTAAEAWRQSAASMRESAAASLAAAQNASPDVAEVLTKVAACMADIADRTDWLAIGLDELYEADPSWDRPLWRRVMDTVVRRAA